jgi:hypothetical protein
MDDDKLLRTLGTLAGEAERDPSASVWERLLRGELAASEVAELEQLAARDEEAASMLSLYRPLDATVREHIASELAAHLAEPGVAITAASATAASTSTTPSTVARPRPARLQPWRARVYAASAAGLALAAGVALFVTHGAEPASLPLYALDVSGAATSRGPSASAPDTSSGACTLHSSARGTFELVARTEATEAGAVTARAFLVRGGETTPWPGALEVSSAGSVRILDSAERLRGATELRVVVGRKELLAPDEALAKARGAARSGRGWQALGCAITPSTDD